MPYTEIISNISKLETNKYRETINNLSYEKLSLVSKIESERLKYVDEQIKLINEDGIFNYLLDEETENLDKYLPEKVMKTININLKYKIIISYPFCFCCRYLITSLSKKLDFNIK